MVRATRPEGARGRTRVGGQGIVEYGVILALSAALAAILLVVFGSTMSAFLQVVGDIIDSAG